MKTEESVVQHAEEQHTVTPMRKEDGPLVVVV